MQTKFLISVILIPVLVSCSPVKIVGTQQAEGFKLANYKTFDFYKVDVSGEPSPSFNERLGWIKDEIAKQLSQRGLVMALENPDLLINIGIAIEEKTQTRETTVQEAPRYMGQRTYHWESQEVVVDHYQEGTVTVDLVDQAKKTMVWEGVASSIIAKNDKESRKNIVNGAEKLFEKMNP
jgi:Domain of unknown function (DUF4136)